MHNFIESPICMWPERIKDKNWKTLHPTQKPLKVLRHIIEIASSDWWIVLDPFMWVWSTWVACKQLKRNFIWIELEKEYFEASQKRIFWIQEKQNINLKLEYIEKKSVSFLEFIEKQLVFSN